MSSRNAQLATLLRQAQWEIETAAFEAGAGRYTAEQFEHLADVLDVLVQLIRSQREQSTIIAVIADE